MKKTIRMMMMAAGLVAIGSCGSAMAQAPSGAPAGSTGQCKDGTYSTAASKQGACRGHQGVKEWYAAASATAAKPASMPAATPASKPAAMPAPAPAATKPAPAAMPAPAPAAAPMAAKPAPTVAKGTAAMTPAAGGGPGMVWVNTSTKVYHCSGTQFYGKTKEGKYMSEADAKAMGAHADHNKPCTK